MMFPYALDGLEDKGNIVNKKIEELSRDFSGILINRKLKKREIEWKTLESPKRIKKDDKEINQELKENERTFKKIKIN